MSKKNIVYAFLIFIGLAFVVVSIMVFFTKGKSKSWIAYKMKIGALLITITAISDGCRVENARCYYKIPDTDTKEINAGVATGKSVESNNESYYSFHTGFGTWKYAPRRINYEAGFNLKLNNSAMNYVTLGPYINGSVRIGYLTDLFAETNCDFSLSKQYEKSFHLRVGISYPNLLFYRTVGVKFFGDFDLYSFDRSMTVFPSVGIYYSIPIYHIKKESTDE
ncbi:hypothetical protein SDC9_52214 [bioreactor metagenome]|uniref:Uncharacterized protein n=1 Tax=bioreactor metagenome TaxID=1076179 RepID=A0A644WQF5_9ZZZZ